MRSAGWHLALPQTEGDGEIPDLTVQTALFIAQGIVHAFADLLRQRPAERRLHISAFHCRDGLGVGSSQSGKPCPQHGGERDLKNRPADALDQIRGGDFGQFSARRAGLKKRLGGRRDLADG